MWTKPLEAELTSDCLFLSRRLGYVPVGDRYDEDGAPHQLCYKQVFLAKAEPSLPSTSVDMCGLDIDACRPYRVKMIETEHHPPSMYSIE